MIGASAPRGAAGPSPGQVWPALASSGWLWPGCGRLWPAAAGYGAAEPGYAAVGPGCGAARPGQVRPDLSRCGRPCTFALVQPSEVLLFIVILIYVYLQVKILTNLVEPH
jgi:hypothetical protein